MTDEQRAQIYALNGCTFGVGSFDKRFVRDLEHAPATLFPIADLMRSAKRLQDWTAHVAQGGLPDGPPSMWKGLPKP